MRAINLKMQAFGPYASYTEIDLSPLNEGVFLITGDTGSGKTSIFDAISFALFGAVSGGKERKNPKTLKSDFVGEGIEPFAEYRFSYREEVYTVKRSLEYKRLRKRGEGETTVPGSAELTLPGGGRINGADNVTKKIEELLGVDQSRFSQIAMIAQGDFRKILTEKSDERSKLFRKVFDTYLYEDFQNRLSALLGESGNEKALITEKIKTLLSAVECDFDEEAEKARENFYEPCIMMRLLEEQNKIDRDEIEKIETDLKKTEETLKELHLKIKNANDDNIIIKRAEELRRQLACLADKKRETEEKRLAADGGDRARDVKVVWDMLCRAEKKYSETTVAEEKKKAEEQKMILDLGEKQKRFEKAERKFDEIPKMKEKRAILDKLIPDIKSLKEKRGNIIKKEKDYIELKRECDRLICCHNTLREKYYDNIAGIMAEGLKEGKPCPVCGAVSHPSPAEPAFENISREDVERAEREADVFVKKMTETAEDISRMKGRYDTLLKRLSESTDIEIIGIDAAEKRILSDLEALKEEIAKNEGEYNSAKDVLNIAENDLSALRGEIKALEEGKIREKKESEICRKRFEAIIIEKGFKDKESYEKCLIPDGELKKLKDEIAEYDDASARLAATCEEAQRAAKGKTLTNTQELVEAENMNSEIKIEKSNIRDKLRSKIDNNVRIYKELCDLAKKIKNAEEKYAMIKEMSDTANGKILGNRITFEAYIQQYYFSGVVQKANLRLLKMTKGKFELFVKRKGGTGGKGGLDLEVLDNTTGKMRDVSTISGGEGFMASLSMALGLSDMIREKNGGIRLDTLFIDEGFGTLDPKCLDSAMEALIQLTDNNLTVGIISHVSELKEKIDKKIVVTKLKDGSSTAHVEV